MSEDLSIELDVCLVKLVDEARVGDSEGAEGGVELYRPKLSTIILLVAAVGKGVYTGVKDGLTCLAFLG